MNFYRDRCALCNINNNIADSDGMILIARLVRLLGTNVNQLPVWIRGGKCYTTENNVLAGIVYARDDIRYECFNIQPGRILAPGGDWIKGTQGQAHQKNSNHFASLQNAPPVFRAINVVQVPTIPIRSYFKQPLQNWREK